MCMLETGDVAEPRPWWVLPKASIGKGSSGKKRVKCLRKYRVPGGRGQRRLAVLRRTRALKPSKSRERHQCTTCSRWRRLGRFWLPRAGKRRANSSERPVPEPSPQKPVWFCENCWLNWRSQATKWFVDYTQTEWKWAFGEDDSLDDTADSAARPSVSACPPSPLMKPKSSACDDCLGGHFDFIEIGTSSYHTFTQAVAGHPDGKPYAWKFLPWDRHPFRIRGLAVDMQRHYLDQLPDLPRVKKVHAAVSESEGIQGMYHVPLREVERWEDAFAAAGRKLAHRKIHMARGCSALRGHRELRRALGSLGLRHLGRLRPVRTCTVEALLTRHRVASVGVLALDCEGHDCAILRSLMRACEKNPAWLPEWIWFESNGLNDDVFGKGTESQTVKDLLSLGYEVWWGGGYRETWKRDTLLRLPRKALAARMSDARAA